jgi:hypothetical protein
MHLTAIQAAFNWPPCNDMSIPLPWVSLVTARCFSHCGGFTAPQRAVNAHPQHYYGFWSRNPDITTAVRNTAHCLTFQTDDNILTRSALVTTLLSCIREGHRSNIGPDTDCPAAPSLWFSSAPLPKCWVFKFDHNQPSSPFCYYHNE